MLLLRWQWLRSSSSSGGGSSSSGGGSSTGAGSSGADRLSGTKASVTELKNGSYH
jgi:hypothetical protein